MKNYVWDDRFQKVNIAFMLNLILSMAAMALLINFIPTYESKRMVFFVWILELKVVGILRTIFPYEILGLQDEPKQGGKYIEAASQQKKVEAK